MLTAPDLQPSQESRHGHARRRKGNGYRRSWRRWSGHHASSRRGSPCGDHQLGRTAVDGSFVVHSPPGRRRSASRSGNVRPARARPCGRPLLAGLGWPPALLAASHNPPPAGWRRSGEGWAAGPSRSDAPAPFRRPRQPASCSGVGARPDHGRRRPRPPRHRLRGGRHGRPGSIGPAAATPADGRHPVGARRSRPAARRTLSAVPDGIHSRAVPSHFQSTPDNCDQRFRHHLPGGTTAGRQRVQPSEQRRRAVENERILAPVSGPCSSRGMLTTDYCHRYPAR